MLSLMKAENPLFGIPGPVCIPLSTTSNPNYSFITEREYKSSNKLVLPIRARAIILQYIKQLDQK